MFFAKYKIEIIITAVIISIVSSIVWWHYDEVDDARQGGIVEQVKETNTATKKVATEKANEVKDIQSSVDSSTSTDNLKLLDQSVQIIAEPEKDSSPAPVLFRLDSSTNDPDGSPEVVTDERSLYTLDNGTGTVEEGVGEDVCQPITYEEGFGYIDNQDCTDDGRYK